MKIHSFARVQNRGLTATIAAAGVPVHTKLVLAITNTTKKHYPM